MRSHFLVAFILATLVLPTTLAGTTVITDPYGDTDLTGTDLCRADALDILAVSITTDAEALTVRMALRDLDAPLVCETAGLLAGARPAREYEVRLLPPELCDERGCRPAGAGVELMAGLGDPFGGDSSCAVVFAPDGNGDAIGYCDWGPATREGDAILWSVPLAGTVPTRDGTPVAYDLRGATLTVDGRSMVDAFATMTVDTIEPTSTTL